MDDTTSTTDTTELRAETVAVTGTGEPGATTTAPPGLEGVVVATTAVGDVRGEEGWYHYRGHDAVELARHHTFEEVWFLLEHGHLPGRVELGAFDATVRGEREVPPPTLELLATVAGRGEPLEVLRTTVSDLGVQLGWGPTLDRAPAEVAAQARRLGAVLPGIVAAAYRRRRGLEPIPPRSDLGHVANYLWMLGGDEPPPQRVRALEQYLILTIDHGFNASTFAARVITSTGADLAAAICGAIGALSGPLHGGAPSRALEMLDRIDDPAEVPDLVRAEVARGARIMGFGHRVYRGADPRSELLAGVARSLGGPRARHALACEGPVLATLAELKPGQRLGTNVEYYAGVVMEACGLAPELFTPTFALSRTIGWGAHVVEQVADNRLIRPSARYVGPPATRAVGAVAAAG